MSQLVTIKNKLFRSKSYFPIIFRTSSNLSVHIYIKNIPLKLKEGNISIFYSPVLGLGNI